MAMEIKNRMEFDLKRRDGPEDPDRYYLRALEVQRERIEWQTEALAKFQRLYEQSVDKCSIGEAIKFCGEVIKNKIGKLYARIKNIGA